MAKSALATNFDRAENSPGLLLWQLSNKWQAKQRVALKQFDITHVQFVLLATLAYAEGTSSFTQKQLADYAQTDIMMTSQVLRKLEQKGLVKRMGSKADKRAILLSPTLDGIALANIAVKAVEAVDSQFFSVLSDEGQQFLQAMQILVSSRD